MTQFGMYSQTTPRNDASPARGQWHLDNAYRYISEAYGGYHFDKMNGINVQAGIFMSYVGLWSYYNFDNWTYQPSYVSSNTPWFFNGMRVQIFPSDKLKIEPWMINGWQSYGKFNHAPGVGGQVLWRPNGSLSILVEQLLGHRHARQPGPQARPHRRQHPGEVLRQARRGASTKAAFTFTFDAGCEYGGGVSCGGGTADAPSQIFLGFMAYHRAVVRQGSVCAHRRRRRDRQPRALPRADAADQRRDGVLRHAVLHGEPWRSVQGVGHAGDVRLHAEPVHHVPRPSSTTGTRTCRTFPGRAA